MAAAGAAGMSEGEKKYPLHRLVWDNRYQELDAALKKKERDAEEADPRGRTPLMLAVTLGHLESTRVLLKHGTNVNVINKGGWTVVQEAVATGDPELLQLVLERRDRQRYTSRVGGIPDLLQKLKSAPDFYVEMKWEFTSWVPFLSRMCPSDTYKVYKQGSNVRIDTTLLGFDQTSWVRGNRTYIFSGKHNGADLYEIDHDTRTVYCEEMKIISPDELDSYVQSEEQISARLTTPLVLTFVDTDKINFERSRSGFWGWGGDKSEGVSGYDSKVFGANNVELITRTRTEHLTEEDKKRAKSNKNPLQSFLGMAEVEVKQAVEASDTQSEFFSANNPCCISPAEYFDGETDLKTRDIGRPKEIASKVQKFQPQLWLCEGYPLSLQEQVMPIVDLMAISNTHFQKLKDFITCSFPAGFPIKIEIPLFHVLNARVTFGNIFALANSIPGIQVLREDDNNRLSCVVDDEVFRIPNDYSRIGGQSADQVRRQYGDDDDQLLQYAIRQSVSGGEIAAAGNSSTSVPAGATANGSVVGAATSGQQPADKTISTEDNGGTATAETEEVDIWEALQGQSPSVTTSRNGGGLVQGQPLPPLPTSSFRDKQMELQIQKAIELSLASAKKEGGEEGESPATPTPSSQNGSSDNSPQLATDQELEMALQMSQKELDSIKKRQMEEDEMLEKALALSMNDK